MQRSCRRRRRSTRWSTTNSTPRSPNSPASKRRRRVVVQVRPAAPSAIVVHSAALLYKLLRCSSSLQLPTTFVESSLLSIHKQNYAVGAFTAAFCLLLYFTENNFYALFYYYSMESEKKRRLSYTVWKLFIFTCSSTYVRISLSVSFLRPAVLLNGRVNPQVYVINER